MKRPEKTKRRGKPAHRKGSSGGTKVHPDPTDRKRVTFTMSHASILALDVAAHYLGLAKSEVVEKLALVAGAAVFWGVQLLPADADPEALRRGAQAGCDGWGLLVLGSRDRTVLRIVREDPAKPEGESS
jgi:hypothetical protein